MQSRTSDQWGKLVIKSLQMAHSALLFTQNQFSCCKAQKRSLRPAVATEADVLLLLLVEVAGVCGSKVQKHEYVAVVLTAAATQGMLSAGRVSTPAAS